MRLQFTLVDDDGHTFSGHAVLSEDAEPRSGVSSDTVEQTMLNEVDTTLKMPLRPFAKRFAPGRGGPQKFTLLLAHLAGGRVGQAICLKDVVKAWNSMTGLMGNFNLAYTTRAKDSGWVDSPEKGFYTLLSSWREAAS
jgi:hypothetical protein